MDADQFSPTCSLTALTAKDAIPKYDCRREQVGSVNGRYYHFYNEERWGTPLLPIGQSHPRPLTMRKDDLQEQERGREYQKILRRDEITNFSRYEELPDELKIRILELLFEDDFEVEKLHGLTATGDMKLCVPTFKATINQSHESSSSMVFKIMFTAHFVQLFTSRRFLKMAIPIYAKSRIFELMYYNT